MRSSVSDADFVDLIRKHGPSGVAKILKIGVRKVYERRAGIEARSGTVIPNKNGTRGALGAHYANGVVVTQDAPGRLHDSVKDGVVLVGSDAHYWAGPPSTAHLAFVHFVREFKPAVVVMNGDAMDGASISRHAPIMWEDRPTVVQELEAVQERLGEIEQASKNSRLYFPLGNHDARFESRLASVAPEYAKVHGVHLKDHLPRWRPCWSLFLNESVVIKHRWKSGIHAAHNNAVQSGMSMVTGHLHSLKVTPWTDYTGTRYGVDTGTMADPFGEQFEYCEDSPRNWRSGFAVLTFRGSRLLWPEVVHVLEEGKVEFRGEIIKV